MIKAFVFQELIGVLHFGLAIGAVQDYLSNHAKALSFKCVES